MFDYGIVTSAGYFAFMVGSAVGIFVVIYLVYVVVAYMAVRRSVYGKV